MQGTLGFSHFEKLQCTSTLAYLHILRGCSRVLGWTGGISKLGWATVYPICRTPAREQLHPVCPASRSNGDWRGRARRWAHATNTSRSTPTDEREAGTRRRRIPACGWHAPTGRTRTGTPHWPAAVFHTFLGTYIPFHRARASREWPCFDRRNFYLPIRELIDINIVNLVKCRIHTLGTNEVS